MEKEKIEEKIIYHPERCVFMETSKLLNSTLDLKELLDLILKSITKAMEASFSSISLYDRKAQELNLYLYSGESKEEKKELRLKLGQGIAGWVAQNKVPVIANQARNDPRFSPELEERIGFRIDSIICVPVLRRGNLLGVMVAMNKLLGKEFTEEDLKIFSSLADQVAIALDNSYLYRKARKESLEKEILLDMDRLISSSLDLDEVLGLILDSLKRLVKYDAAAIFLIDREKQEVGEIKTRGFDPAIEPDLRLKMGQGLVGWVAQHKETVIVPDVDKDSRYIKARHETKSEILAPIMTDRRIIGVFNLESNQVNAYDSDDLNLLTAFASHCAVAIERTRLHKEIIVKKKLEEELLIARNIQQSFLPAEDPNLAGFDISGINIPSEQVGGDYYDFIPIVENQIGIAIGDVSGKGIPAALIMASFRASLKAEIRNNYAIRTICFKVNNLLYESLERENYVTAVYGVLDIKNRIFTFSNAGHNPPVLRKKEGKIRHLTEGGLALGVIQNSEYKERVLNLKPGDIILFYTDGVTEAKNESDEEFGTKRLEKILSENPGLKAKELQDKIYQEVKDFTGNKPGEDDLTMILIKVLEA
ncbi:MAG: SpoIIE family protein phosphatase [candidate division Zixibacteria bacterium]|nr:SpoIIE family protein phosphatase [candidate division Zixibacteria bacterium]